MSVIIEKEGTMREGINRAVDTGMLQQQQLTEWRRILFAILAQFDAMPDDYVIVVQGDTAATDGLHFATQMRIPLGVLRGMK